MQAEALTKYLAQLRGYSRRQAHGLRNRGLAVLEAFELIEIERFHAICERGHRITYGSVAIIRNKIDEKQAQAKKKQAETDRRNEMLCQAFMSIEEQ